MANDTAEPVDRPLAVIDDETLADLHMIDSMQLQGLEALAKSFVRSMNARGGVTAMLEESVAQPIASESSNNSSRSPDTYEIDQSLTVPHSPNIEKKRPQFKPLVGSIFEPEGDAAMLEETVAQPISSANNSSSRSSIVLKLIKVSQSCPRCGKGDAWTPARTPARKGRATRTGT